jgi:hypothetical protein
LRHVAFSCSLLNVFPEEYILQGLDEHASGSY